MTKSSLTATPPPDELRWDSQGLIPGVVQDARTGQVLMVAYLNRESYLLTLESGYVHFWSRSRGELWLKGATSGSLLEVVKIESDCDADTLLIAARPAGPACHRNTVTCFDDKSPWGGVPVVGAVMGSDRFPRRPERPVRLLHNPVVGRAA